jgi:hypothetical protein
MTSSVNCHLARIDESKVRRESGPMLGPPCIGQGHVVFSKSIVFSNPGLVIVPGLEKWLDESRLTEQRRLS